MLDLYDVVLGRLLRDGLPGVLTERARQGLGDLPADDVVDEHPRRLGRDGVGLSAEDELVGVVFGFEPGGTGRINVDAHQAKAGSSV